MFHYFAVLVIGGIGLGEALGCDVDNALMQQKDSQATAAALAEWGVKRRELYEHPEYKSRDHKRRVALVRSLGHRDADEYEDHVIKSTYVGTLKELDVNLSELFDMLYRDPDSGLIKRMPRFQRDDLLEELRGIVGTRGDEGNVILFKLAAKYGFTESAALYAKHDGITFYEALYDAVFPTGWPTAEIPPTAQR